MQKGKAYSLRPTYLYRLLLKLGNREAVAKHIDSSYSSVYNAMKHKTDHIIIPIPPHLNKAHKLEIYDWVIEGFRKAADFDFDYPDGWWDE